MHPPVGRREFLAGLATSALAKAATKHRGLVVRMDKAKAEVNDLTEQVRQAKLELDLAKTALEAEFKGAGA